MELERNRHPNVRFGLVEGSYRLPPPTSSAIPPATQKKKHDEDNDEKCRVVHVAPVAPVDVEVWKKKSSKT